jgi:hypothetical protein
MCIRDRSKDGRALLKSPAAAQGSHLKVDELNPLLHRKRPATLSSSFHSSPLLPFSPGKICYGHYKLTHNR